MKKNECAQEMLLDFVMRMNGEVVLRPVRHPGGEGLELVLRHKGYNASTIIDFSRLGYCAADAERITCEIIRMELCKLFRLPYDEIMDKHFGG